MKHQLMIGLLLSSSLFAQSDLEKRCLQNEDGEACYTLAKEAQAKGDKKEWIDKLTKACKTTIVPQACYDLSKAVEDKSESKSLTKQACDDTVASACYDLAQKAEKEDKEKAAKLYLKACDLGDNESCYKLGMLTLEGVKGTDYDNGYAPDMYFRKACHSGLIKACDHIKTGLRPE